MEGPVSKESDVYSFAMIVIEVRTCDLTMIEPTAHPHKAFTGRAPFYDSRPTTVAVDVLSGIRPERPAHSSLTDDVWNLTQRCWDHDPEQRPGISEVVAHLRGNYTSQSGDDVTWDGMTFGSLQQGDSPLGKFSCSSYDKVLNGFRRVVFLVIPVDGPTSATLEVRQAPHTLPCSRKSCSRQH
jgi:serine/threonine protein kinase